MLVLGFPFHRLSVLKYEKAIAIFKNILSLSIYLGRSLAQVSVSSLVHFIFPRARHFRKKKILRLDHKFGHKFQIQLIQSEKPPVEC